MANQIEKLNTIAVASIEKLNGLTDASMEKVNALDLPYTLYNNNVFDNSKFKLLAYCCLEIMIFVFL